MYGSPVENWGDNNGCNCASFEKKWEEQQQYTHWSLLLLLLNPLNLASENIYLALFTNVVNCKRRRPFPFWLSVKQWPPPSGSFSQSKLCSISIFRSIILVNESAIVYLCVFFYAAASGLLNQCLHKSNRNALMKTPLANTTNCVKSNLLK